MVRLNLTPFKIPGILAKGKKLSINHWNK